MSKKYLYSNGNYIFIYKEGYKENKLVANTEWDMVKNARKEGSLFLVKSSNGTHAIDADKYTKFIEKFRQQMDVADKKKQDAFDRASMHQNCYAGDDS